MWKHFVDCIAQAMKGIDDSLQWWHQPTVKDKFVVEEYVTHRHKQLGQILNMKLQRQRQKAKHKAFSINAKMKKNDQIRTIQSLEEDKEETQLK